MSNVPQRNSSRWIDLIAFLAVLALGGVLIALGHITAGSLATICAALGGLYGVWMRLHSSNEAPPAVKPDGKQDEELR
jgi:ABC-type multidrug transport system fused ATPase/permease subunit